MGVLFRVVGDRAQAEELAGDVFGKAYRQPPPTLTPRDPQVAAGSIAWRRGLALMRSGPGRGAGGGPGQGYGTGSRLPDGGGGYCGNGDGVEVAHGSLRPTITYREKAKYTEEARQQNVQGTVVLSAIFGADGGVHNIRVVRGLPSGLTEKAIEAARNIRFRPAVKNGVPVSVRMTLEFNFAVAPPLFQFGIRRRRKRCAAPRCNTS